MRDFTDCKRNDILWSHTYGEVRVHLVYTHGIFGRTSHGFVYWDRDGFRVGCKGRDLYHKKPKIVEDDNG